MGYRYGSGMITPLTQSNAVAVIPEEKTFLDAGEVISVIPIGRG
jgi:molybdopterin biosynthesis enzyme